MTLKTDAKFEGKLTCAFKNDIRNLANFHRLKINDFILESKMAELNQNKNSKLVQIGQINSTSSKAFYTFSTESLLFRY